ncbi:MAG TPA: ROK family protein [Kineosporiaceae bacterium]|nr:ROK family protein [Kineosporiaceae bacterium]
MDLVSTTDLGARNARLIAEAILDGGAVSRAQLSRSTGLSKPTVSIAIAALQRDGVIREVGRTSGHPGATAVLYDVAPDAGTALAVDVGRRLIRACVTDLAGRRLAERTEPTRGTSAAVLAAQLVALAADLVAESGVRGTALVAVTVGVPGVVAPDGGRVRLARSLPGLQRGEPAAALREALGVPVELANDVNLAATAELAFGHGRRAPDFAFLSVGTGIGLALVLDGRLRSGATRSAGEIGYLPVPPASEAPAVPPGPAPRRRRPAGHVLEEVAAAEGVVRAARRRGLRASSARAVIEHARAGDTRALEVVREQARHLAMGVVAVSAVVDPGLIVLSGGLGIGAADVLLPLLDDEVRRLGPLRPTLVVSELGDHAVLDGAAVAAVSTARERVLGRVPGLDDDARGAPVHPAPSSVPNRMEA